MNLYFVILKIYGNKSFYLIAKSASVIEAKHPNYKSIELIEKDIDILSDDL